MNNKNTGTSDEVKIQVFDFLSAHTDESNAVWSRFRKTTHCAILFPIPDYAFLDLDTVTEPEKIAWVTTHHRILSPLLAWWNTEHSI